MIGQILAVVVLIFIGYQLYYYRKKKATKTYQQFSEEWLYILNERVSFYRELLPKQQQQFQSDFLDFLNSVSIKGVQCEVDDVDRVLIGASATIPLFGFPDSTYPNLTQVLLYANRFNKDHEIDPSHSILGMVGTGYMTGSMILSKPDLRAGFLGKADARNVGIHEFAHLVDKFDGDVDGIPDQYLNQPYTLQWIELLRRKTEEIQSGNSDINDYALTGPEEFFAVAAEYFFEDPERMAKKHPQLHKALQDVFRQKVKTGNPNVIPQRNEPCPCGSGRKFKKCHGSTGRKRQ